MKINKSSFVQSVSEVLKVHLSMPKLNLQHDKPMKRTDGRAAIVDLMLTLSIRKINLMKEST
ncbi:hypothetical protein L2725_20050 [Shewanella corallii]|uniref:Uncharacterized protein n=1 Tax=Shewanella corallii TaxID=560080 RepID=A0ABT0NCF0_9GAMM|nr:hypothetical protein [Shewanella corallii]MCL2916037.1 hypothetical protein [Shewanella corallii]